MTTRDIIGKTITDIYVSLEMEVGGLDTGECFLELDGETFISLPFGHDSENLEAKPPFGATSIFKELSDIPVYHVNKEGKTIAEIADSHKKRENSLANKLQRFFFGKQSSIPKEYRPYKVEYQENKLKHLKGIRVVDFFWYADDTEKGLLLLENGYLITETLAAPHGTGLAGLNLFESIDELTSRRGEDYLKFSDTK